MDTVHSLGLHNLIKNFEMHNHLSMILIHPSTNRKILYLEQSTRDAKTLGLKCMVFSLLYGMRAVLNMLFFVVALSYRAMCLLACDLRDGNPSSAK